MDELIAEIERAEVGSRELDYKIAVLVGFGLEPLSLPHYTTSLDAALQLVPEGAYAAGVGFSGAERSVGRGWAWVQMISGGDRPMQHAATPALALVAGCLRARG